MSKTVDKPERLLNVKEVAAQCGVSVAIGEMETTMTSENKPMTRHRQSAPVGQERGECRRSAPVRAALGTIVESLLDAAFREHGMSPTFQEIADAHKIDKVTAWEHVKALKKKGVVKATGRGARSIKPVESGWEDVVKRLEKVVGEADMPWNVRLELVSILADAKKLLEGK